MAENKISEKGWCRAHTWGSAREGKAEEEKSKEGEDEGKRERKKEEGRENKKERERKQSEQAAGARHK